MLGIPVISGIRIEGEAGSQKSEISHPDDGIRIFQIREGKEVFPEIIEIEQNNNLFMMGYRVGYNDMTEINAETKAVLMKLYSTIRNIEITLSCRLLDDETEERVIRVLGDVK